MRAKLFGGVLDGSVVEWPVESPAAGMHARFPYPPAPVTYERERENPTTDSMLPTAIYESVKIVESVTEGTYVHAEAVRGS